MPRARAARRKFLEIAKLATERVKKPEVCIDLWHEVLANDETNAEALGALAGLYERAKDFEKLGDGAREAGRDHLRRAGEDPGPRQARDDLRRAAEQRRGRRRRLAHAPRRSTRTIAARRSAQEEVPRPRALGRPRGLLRRERQVGRVHPRPRAARGEGDRAPQPKISLLFKIAQLWGDKKQKLDRAAKAYEKVLELEPKNLQAAEALIPIYTAGEQRQGARRTPSRSSSATSRTRRQARALPRGRRPLRGQGQGAAEGLRALPARRSSSPRATRSTSEDVERAARATGALGRGHRRLPPGHRGGGPTRAIASVGDHAAPAPRARPRRERCRRSTRRSTRTAPSTTPTARTPRPSPRSSSSTGRRRASRELLGIYEKKRDLSHDARREEGDQLRDRQALRERDQGRRPARSTPTSRCSRTSRATRRRSPRSTCSTAARALGAVRRRPAPAHRARRQRGASSSISSSGSARRSRSTSATPPARSRTTARSCSSTPTHEGARARARGDARGRAPRRGRGDPRVDLRGARRLAEAHSRARDPRARAEDDLEKRVALKRKAARISAERVNDLGARVRRRWRRRCEDDPSLAETRDEIERIAEGSGALARARRPLRRARGEPHRRAARARLLDAHRRHRRAARRRRRGGAGLLQGARASTRPTPRRSPRSSALHAHRALGGSHRRRRAPHRADQRRRRSARRSTRTMAQIYDERLGRPEDAIAAYQKVLELEPGSDRALTRARRPLHAPEDVGRARREPRGAARARRRRTTRSSRSCCASRRCASAKMGLVDVGHRGVPPGPRARRRRTPQALAALERLGQDARVRAHHRRSPRAALPARRRLAEAHRRPRGAGPAQRRRHAPRRAPPPDRAALRGRRRASSTPAFATLARALEGGPGERGDAAAARSRRPRDRPLRRSRAASSRSSPAQIEDPTLASALYMMSARVQETDLGNIDSADRASTARCSRSTR